MNFCASAICNTGFPSLALTLDDRIGSNLEAMFCNLAGKDSSRRFPGTKRFLMVFSVFSAPSVVSLLLFMLLWSRRELRRSGDRAVLHMGDAAVDQQVAVAVGHAEGVRPGAHAGIGLHEVIV
jgi:hypothetical protein